MRQASHVALVLFIAAAAMAAPAFACDMTCIYSQPDEDGNMSQQRFSLALFLQNSDIDSLQLDGSAIDNPMGEFIDSTVTQTVLSYRMAPRWSMQLNLPYIDRSYERMVDGAMEAGSETGIGDAMLMARYIGRERYLGMTRLHWSGGVGLELPTGDSDRLGEHHGHGAEHDTGHVTASVEEPHGEAGHGHGTEESVAIGSGIHGHELALGNGALDYIASASVGLSRGWELADSDAAHAASGGGLRLPVGR